MDGVGEMKSQEKTDHWRWTRCDAMRGDSQVALRAVGTPAQAVLKVLAGHASALLKHVARYRV